MYYNTAIPEKLTAYLKATQDDLTFFRANEQSFIKGETLADELECGRNKHIGSDFDDWLKEEGICE